jgi:hypothetical protein
MTLRTGRGSLLVLSALVVALVASVAYARWTRRMLLPAELRFIAPESNVILGLGPLESLWDGVEFHLGRVLREEQRQGKVAELLTEVRRSLEEKGLPVQDKAGLSRLGLDISRGVLAGLRVGSRSMAFTAVVPVRDQAAFTSSLRRLTDEEEDDAAEGPTDACGDATAIGDILLAWPTADIALVSNECGLLRTALQDQARNLAHARANDELIDAVRGQLRRPMLSGAGIVAWFRGWPHGFAPAASAAVALNFVSDAILLNARVSLEDVHADLWTQVAARAEPARPWRHLLDPETAAALVIEDPYLTRYLALSRNNDEFDSFAGTFFGGLLQAVQRVDRVPQLVVALADYQEGIPQVLLGLWGNEADLASLVFDMQSRLRDARDREVILGAISGRQPAPTVEATRATLAEIARTGLEAPEDAAWLGRYGWPSNELALVRRPTAGDFETEEYVEVHRGRRIRYLEPRVNANDLEHRSAFADIDQPSAQVLLENRYRLAVTQMDTTLWVATRSTLLRHLIDRSVTAEVAAHERSFAVGSDWQHESQKAALFVAMPTLIKLGFLSGEGTVQDIARQGLLDLRYHHRVVAALEPQGDGRHLALRLRAQGPVERASR